MTREKLERELQNIQAELEEVDITETFVLKMSRRNRSVSTVNDFAYAEAFKVLYPFCAA